MAPSLSKTAILLVVLLLLLDTYFFILLLGVTVTHFKKSFHDKVTWFLSTRVCDWLMNSFSKPNALIVEEPCNDSPKWE